MMQRGNLATDFDGAETPFISNSSAGWNHLLITEGSKSQRAQENVMFEN